MNKLIFSFLFCFNSWAVSLEMASSLNGTQDFEMQAGAPATISMQYLNSQTRAPFSMFMKMHAKLQHMVIISSDLTHFAHIHPTWIRSEKRFKIDLNTQTSDFDNQMLPNAMPYAGEYFVFTEAMGMMGSDHFMQMDRFSLKATGTPSPKIADTVFADASVPLVRYFELNGDLSIEGAPIRVEFSYEALDFCDSVHPKFYFTVSEFDGTNYIPATDFDKWLEMGGHAVLLSASNVDLKDRRFHHLHAFLPIATPGEFTFPYDSHLPQLHDGDYKVWAQFLYKGEILTINFPFHMVLPPSNKCK